MYKLWGKFSIFTRLYGLFITTPEPNVQVHYCDRTSSIVRMVILNFSHFDLPATTRQKSTKLHRKKNRNIHYQVCVFSSRFSRSENHVGRHGIWLLRHFFLIFWTTKQNLTKLDKEKGNLTKSKNSTFSTQFVFLGVIGKPRWPPWL